MRPDENLTLARALARHFGPELHGKLTAKAEAATMAPLRAAVSAALSAHQPAEGAREWQLPGERPTLLCSCWGQHGGHPLWPCAELADIISALLEPGNEAATAEEASIGERPR